MKCLSLVVFCILAAAFLSPVTAQSPGWTLADTHPDTGGRAPVSPGGKVMPPGSSPLSVLAGCSGDIDKICQGRSGLYSARACLTENKAKLSPRCVVDLGKAELELVFQGGIDRRQQRLHHVVEQMAETNRAQHRKAGVMGDLLGGRLVHGGANLRAGPVLTSLFRDHRPCAGLPVAPPPPPRHD